MIYYLIDTDTLIYYKISVAENKGIQFFPVIK